MTPIELPINQHILNVVGEPVEKLIWFYEIDGLAFVQVSGGEWRIVNTFLQQTMKRRFQDLELARHFAVSRLCTFKK